MVKRKMRGRKEESWFNRTGGSNGDGKTGRMKEVRREEFQGGDELQMKGEKMETDGCRKFGG